MFALTVPVTPIKKASFPNNTDNLAKLLSHFSHAWLCATTRLPRPWDSPGKNTGVGCHFLLQCMKVKSEKWSRSVVSDSLRPHGLQPTRLLHPWDFPGKSTGVGHHRLLWPQTLVHVKVHLGRNFSQDPDNTSVDKIYLSVWTNCPQSRFSGAAFALSLSPLTLRDFFTIDSEKMQVWAEQCRYWLSAHPHTGIFLCTFHLGLLPRSLVLTVHDSLLLKCPLRALFVDKILTNACLKYHKATEGSIKFT